ncbi:MAG: 30S ribosomal protein S1 [Bacteroidota bacterium]|nr:30S ribosomal protein S1 [Bacteroidota bacterium]
MSEEQLRADTPSEESHENLVPTSVASENDAGELAKDVPADPPTSDSDQAPETTIEPEASEVSEDNSADSSTSDSDQAPEATTEPDASEASEDSPADPSTSESDQSTDATTSESDQATDATTEPESSEASEDSPADPSTSESDQASEVTIEPEASEASEGSSADPSTSESDRATDATTEPEASEASEDSSVDPSTSESDQAPEAISEPETEATTEPEASDPEGEAQESADPEDTDEGAERIGYTGDILGETVPLSELDERQETSEAEQERAEELTQLIDASLNEVVKDEIITGQIISVSDKDVVIDIGFKSDGIIPRNEFEGEVNPGDTLEVYVERLENYHGQLQLSKERAEKVRRWERIERAFENGTVLEGTITRRIKGGMIVDLIDGLEAFLPGSQIDMRPVRDFDSYLDRKMEFKIVKINSDNENVVVSHKALIERDLASQRESILSTMEAGQVLEGVAKNITNFGVFVDLGGVDGLLHITDLTWGRVSHPTEVVSLDENLKVVVLDYDKDRQRISLGLKQLQPHPWENIEERYKPGDVVEGKVVSITDYGAFLEIEQGIEGLVHVSEMSWTGHIRHPSRHVSLGQVVKVFVLSIDHSTKKISLGMKQFETNPWEGISMRYPPGTVLSGRVRNITHFGVFVEIEPGIDGLVHVSDLSWTKTIRHPSEIVKKRQELSVVVLDVDEKRQRIALGHKQIETNPWTNLATVYEAGTDHQAKVVRVERKGLTVELPLEVEAFVPIRELKNKSTTGFPPYQEGDEIELRVIRLDASQKEIVMSETAKQRQEKAKIEQSEREAKRAVRREEEKAVRQHTKREKATSGPTTIGELSGLESLKKLNDEATDTSPVEE